MSDLEMTEEEIEYLKQLSDEYREALYDRLGCVSRVNVVDALKCGPPSLDSLIKRSKTNEQPTTPE